MNALATSYLHIPVVVSRQVFNLNWWPKQPHQQCRAGENNPMLTISRSVNHQMMSRLSTGVAVDRNERMLALQEHKPKQNFHHRGVGTVRG
jgi:hypothetical protein